MSPTARKATRSAEARSRGSYTRVAVSGDDEVAAEMPDLAMPDLAMPGLAMPGLVRDDLDSLIDDILYRDEGSRGGLGGPAQRSHEPVPPLSGSLGHASRPALPATPPINVNSLIGRFEQGGQRERVTNF